METIKNYLENIFARLPKTDEILHVKEDMLNTMEDKYRELKEKGHTENEAAGIVISEFGNLDELLSELNITIEEKDKDQQYDGVTVTFQQAEEFIADRNKFGFFIAGGVFLILFGVSLLVLMSGIAEVMLSASLEALALIPFLLCLAIAIGSFVFSGIYLSKYDYIEKECITIDTTTRYHVTQLKENYRKGFTISITAGVVLCFASPFVVMIAGKTNQYLLTLLATSFLLCSIGVAVFLMVNAGMKMDTYNLLLQTEDYTVSKKKANKYLDIISTIFWLFVTAIYLTWSFVTSHWDFTWIIWPVASILYAIISVSAKGIMSLRNKA